MNLRDGAIAGKVNIETWVKNNLIFPEGQERAAPTIQELLDLADAILNASN